MSQQEALTAGVHDSATTPSEVTTILPPPAAPATEAAELLPPPAPTESAGIEPGPSLGEAEVSDEPALPENWGRLGHLTPEQQSASEAFLSKHESALELNKYPSESSVNVALRFLRARKFDLELASDLLFECNKRKREGGAFVCKELSPAECAKCDVVAMKNFYPHTMAGFDKQGRPILWEVSGALNVTALLVMMSRETLINYHWWTMETKLAQQFAAAAVRKPSQPPNATFAVLDFTGFGLSHLTPACLNQLKCFISMDNVCYPETLGKLLVINAPWIAVNSWGLVKSWLDPRTVNKIEILSAADSIKRMHELIDLDQIPPMYGGSGPDLYFPKPNTECVQVSARGEVVRYFDLLPHAEAVVDSYATEGPLECVVCVLTTAEAARFKALKTPVQKALASFNVPERRLLHRSELAPTTGVPTRRLLRHSSAELGTDKGEAKVLLAMWTNAARISSRNLVYTVTIEAPSSVGNG